MAVGKEILTRIRSVQNTQKITKAMQMVSTSKMRKTQERMRQARPYADKIRLVMSHLAQTHSSHNVPLLRSTNNSKRVGFIVITTDKGLCGGLNANILKAFFSKVQECNQQGLDAEVVCLGSKGLAACNRVGLNVIASAVGLGDTPRVATLLGPLTEIFQRYAEGKLDAIYLVYSGFINTMRQEPRLETLLPIGQNVLDQVSESKEYGWEYVYEPSPQQVLEFLVRRYLESVVYQALSENMAAEQAARMVAMKAATDNASNAIKELRLVYNKSRQAAITTELSEIVAGAAAV
ncbi:F0F1 ATP synthase subunit gamma [Snodgrassella communis]|jgi:F-type H+-transporting ATPase subunit gamma|uniref:ATP synthase gamma chain n=2 Tax=Snodgrassella TaxID=1193515 RepID=A0A2N9XQG2_9NEIS|nr:MULTISPECIES: F0F1 ATP synthase subunit gamma [Snodgrassella]KDN12425.1 ATP synthase gamma chain [Snodgrassella communis]KDN14836.1 ATP synthase gamma chain [Snodgrassella communis]PIT08725.1 F0F1 ATP synthase subunit gamma [Snodgrassella communis]PIT08799.1 F0F1 ATP synthase subunit gamma [Snodgrassella communis]PIT24300.1 F0F1 ATP synthase subunit gamma [Snodgrassella communis]